MKVKAAKGLRVPKENRANDYIEDTPIEVSETVYYRRLVADGDLILLPDSPLPTAPKGGKND